jgi:hypothetical protein
MALRRRGGGDEAAGGVGCGGGGSHSRGTVGMSVGRGTARDVRLYQNSEIVRA